MIVKKIFLNLIILVSIIYLSSYLFASVCTLGTPPVGVVVAGDPSLTSTTAIFDVIQQGPFIRNDLVFTPTGCTGLSVYVRLNNNFLFEIAGAKSNLKISGIDGVILNNTNITIKDTSLLINSKGAHASLGSPTINELLSYFDFDVNEIIANGNSSIKYLEDSSNQVCIWINSKIKLKFDNLIIYENGTLDLQITAGNHSITSNWCSHANFDGDGDSGYYSMDLINSSNVVLEGKNILNEGTLNLTVQGGNGYAGYTPPEGVDSLWGGLGGNGGDVILDLDEINNFGTITTFDIIGGDSGRGGNGMTPPQDRPGVSPGRGGNGGIGGVSIININNGIYNFSDLSLVNLNLLAGNGGRGGDSGFDRGVDNGNYCIGTNENDTENQCGGWGGPGGNIFISSLGSLFNKGTLNISATAGNGNNGGEKVNHECYGLNGNGGNAGSIYGMDIGLGNDIDITNLINNGSLDFTLKSGINGNYIGDGCWEIEKNGNLGSISRLDINYFDNQVKEGLIVLKDTQLTAERYADYVSNIGATYPHYNMDSYIPYPGDIIIRNLKSGSYTPEKTEINQEDMLTRNRKIVIAGCNVNENSEVTLKSKENYIIVSNPYGFTVNATPNPFLKFYENCIPCDNSNLLGADRISDVYSIYSTIEGTIDSKDLNIYYTDSEGNILALNNPFFANKPLYTNQYSIAGVFDKKTGLYKYEIRPENLLWYDNPEYIDNYTLSIADAPYCAGQQYFIEGKIDGHPFEFPFIPLFKSN